MDKHEDTFKLLKRKILEASVLALLNLQKQFDVETNTSNYALGEILKQDGKPIEYYSKMFQAIV